MRERTGSPGSYSPYEKTAGMGAVERVRPSAPDPELDWAQYLDRPSEDRRGISCSGGGIRSAAYCLGALQELRARAWLGKADYLTCVSGGGYIAIAHEVLVSKSVSGAACADDPTNPFAAFAPYEIGSPEERHLRSHLDYLTPGLVGRIWAAINLVGGMIRHLLPFVVILYLAAWATGMTMTRWLGRSLGACAGYALPCEKAPPVPPGQQVSLEPFLWIVLGALLLTIAFVICRQWVQGWSNPDDDAIGVLQGWALWWFCAVGFAAFFLVLVPAGLLLLHTRPFDLNGLGKTLTALGVQGGLVGGLVALVRLVSKGKAKTFGTIATLLLTPIVVLLPFLGFTYWIAQGGPHLFSGAPKSMAHGFGLTAQTSVLAMSALLFVAFLFTNETTSLPHLFYRERLATAFIGKRTRGAYQELGYDQLPWSEALKFSDLDRCETGPAALPRLVVCANVNASEVVPPGRGGASFTFEKDFMGGPVTGYVRTTSMEQRTKLGTVTLPAGMAISGAAVAPSMGKMTRAGLRFAMALFDLRLGVWLPNPGREGWDRFTALDVWAERQLAEPIVSPLRDADAARVRVDRPFRRPGMKYVFFEALGMNSLRDQHVYVTDGGHFENLGLVELLRRGCGRIVCLDAAGDDVHHFNTLSEAIDLARADLGVEFHLNLGPLTPPGEDQPSSRCCIRGTFTYPNGVEGTILFVKAAICENLPIEVLAYKERDARFPSHPTTDQFFNEMTFESYRALGQHAVREGFEGGLAP